jgi:hypothetical protein
MAVDDDGQRFKMGKGRNRPSARATEHALAIGAKGGGGWRERRGDGYERSFAPGWFSTSLAYASVSHRHASLVHENPVIKG